MDDEGRAKLRRRLKRAAAIATVVLTVLGTDFLLRHPSSPLPPEWNPLAPLRIDEPVTFVTRLKLGHAVSDPQRCLAALADAGTDAVALPDIEEGPACGIVHRVRISRLGDVQMRPFETRCEVALRLAFWARHGLEPAARDAFGTGIARIEHQSSYACREMRTGHGPTGKMSLHATAEALDVTGVVLANGRRVSLKDGWDGAADARRFLRAARNSACRWFITVLGPDYNALHADHFHLQSRGWGLCR